MMKNTNNIQNYRSVITLNNLSAMVKLGLHNQERSEPQEILISLKFYFSDKPKGCLTDNIEDTICYYEASEIITNLIRNREFKLIEHIGHELYSVLRAEIDKTVKIWVKIDKLNPPIENLKGSASFEYSDR